MSAYIDSVWTEIKVVRSGRRSIGIEIRGDGQILVRAPQWVRNSDLKRFLEEKEGWIRLHREKAKRQAAKETVMLTDEDVKRLGEEALSYLPQRVKYFAPLVGVSYGRITIRNQRTRWGSCSAKGNLNFNCLLMLCPSEVRDYVVVHELCHRLEMNHSPGFWAEVARVIPDYKIYQRWLKENGGQLIRRMEDGQR